MIIWNFIVIYLSNYRKNKDFWTKYREIQKNLLVKFANINVNYICFKITTLVEETLKLKRLKSLKMQRKRMKYARLIQLLLVIPPSLENILKLLSLNEIPAKCNKNMFYNLFIFSLQKNRKIQEI